MHTGRERQREVRLKGAKVLPVVDDQMAVDQDAVAVAFTSTGECDEVVALGRRVEVPGKAVGNSRGWLFKQGHQVIKAAGDRIPTDACGVDVEGVGLLQRGSIEVLVVEDLLGEARFAATLCRHEVGVAGKVGQRRKARIVEDSDAGSCRGQAFNRADLVEWHHTRAAAAYGCARIGIRAYDQDCLDPCLVQRQQVVVVLEEGDGLARGFEGDCVVLRVVQRDRQDRAAGDRASRTSQQW